MRSISAARPEPLTARCPTAGKASLPRCEYHLECATRTPRKGSGETASETGRFFAQVGLSLWNWPCGQQFRPLESRDSRSASNAPRQQTQRRTGFLRGQSFRLRSGLRGEWDGSRRSSSIDLCDGGCPTSRASFTTTGSGVSSDNRSDTPSAALGNERGFTHDRRRVSLAAAGG